LSLSGYPSKCFFIVFHIDEPSMYTFVQLDINALIKVLTCTMCKSNLNSAPLSLGHFAGLCTDTYTKDLIWHLRTIYNSQTGKKRYATKKILLDEDQIPKQWYNIVPDLPKPLPPFIDPATKEPGVGIVPRIFPKEIIGQEISCDRWITIPEEVRDVYRLWRPTPLFRAIGLEKALKTPAKIYYKYEGTSPAGSHKPTLLFHKRTTT
jgi:hypothetical protein